MLPVSDKIIHQARRDIRKLYPRLEVIPNGSGSASTDSPEGWISGLRNRRLYYHDDRYPNVLNSYMGLSLAIGTLTKWLRNLSTDKETAPALRQVMVNALEPHSGLAIHRDPPPEDMRFHLPIFTNPYCKWWDEVEGERHMPVGEWSDAVYYCGVKHSMVNDGDSIRVHLIADYYTPIVSANPPF